MKQTRRGFTIVELAVVIAVIAILATVVFVTLNTAQGRARDAKRKTDIVNITKALEQYYSTNGTYPLPTNTTGGLISASGVDQYWFVSGGTSWTNFATALSGKIDTLPTEPRNDTLAASNGGYAYAYYAGDYTTPGRYCGTAAGQFYVLMYRTEFVKAEQYTDGTCGGTEIGTSNVNSSYSYYRVVH